MIQFTTICPLVFEPVLPCVIPLLRLSVRALGQESLSRPKKSLQVNT